VASFRFVFWEALKALSLIFLALLAAQAIGRLGAEAQPGRRGRLVRGSLYAAVVALAALGARGVGYDLAAQFYFWASQNNLEHSQASRAYTNALRAVELRPGNFLYWQALARSKFSAQQYQSLLEDEPDFRSLGGGRLQEEDALRFAFAYFFLAQYDQVIPLTREIIQENPYYAAPRVLEGMTYLSQKRYAEAERRFLEVLQMFPTQEEAVRGLAQVYFLRGERARALAVLNETSKFPFPPEARKRFEDLKALHESGAGDPGPGAGVLTRSLKRDGQRERRIKNRSNEPGGAQPR
jgi:tetratricopeptide (TPR) repeat protein